MLNAGIQIGQRPLGLVIQQPEAPIRVQVAAPVVQVVRPPAPAQIVNERGAKGDLGPIGPQGPEGPQGPQGVRRSFTYDPGPASALWHVQHDLGFYPNVIIQDSAMSVVFADVNHIDLNSLEIVFAHPMGGRAILS